MAVDPPQAPYQRILAAVDGSETAAAGLLEAIRIARLTRGSLHLVHVVDGLEHLNRCEPCAPARRCSTPRSRAPPRTASQRTAD
jgi:nucleotide-binding universal stress UspA family protein